MRIFDMLFGHKNESDASIKDMELSKKITINNYPVDEINDDDLYPWSNQVVYRNDVTIGNIIMLWWLDKYWDKEKTIPNYFEKKYVKNFKIERRKLTYRGFIKQSGELTDLGQAALSNNYEYIDKHRNNWITAEDKERNSALHYSQMENVAKQDELWGMHDHAKELNQQMSDEKERDALLKPYFEAEKLGKQGDSQRSLDILQQLLPRLNGKNRYLRAFVIERIAIDSRKLKKYDSEIHYLNEYIIKEKGQYRYTEYKEKFFKRIAKATQLLDKQRSSN
ncbi:hypothetical protein [Latilactobacillus curvatus]|uniref:Uncharacterized protein n=1 Tax=Latilactobacillus curvatus TaxID=28038 RepID=A0ABM7QW05_LATCU|nr:hypothetical protein [Latilactobacillus curvatus]BCX31290.1 hypothetical protein LTWDN19_18570 [Latilactobacillus curvatus]